MTFDRDLTRSVAEPIVLQLLKERAMYGYEIIKVVNVRSDNAFQWKEGTLYPCLHRLEKRKLIESYWEEPAEGRKRKYYALSKAGAKLCDEKVAQWKAFSTVVGSLLFTNGDATA